jgi:hypothetical protein
VGKGSCACAWRGAPPHVVCGAPRPRGAVCATARDARATGARAAGAGCECAATARGHGRCRWRDGDDHASRAEVWLLYVTLLLVFYDVAVSDSSFCGTSGVLRSAPPGVCVDIRAQMCTPRRGLALPCRPVAPHMLRRLLEPETLLAFAAAFAGDSDPTARPRPSVPRHRPNLDIVGSTAARASTRHQVMALNVGGASGTTTRYVDRRTATQERSALTGGTTSPSPSSRATPPWRRSALRRSLSTSAVLRRC